MAAIISFTVGTNPAVKTALSAGAAALIDSMANSHAAISVPVANLNLLKEATAIVLSGQGIYLVKANNTIAVLKQDDPVIQHSSTGELKIVSTILGKTDIMINRADAFLFPSVAAVDWAALLTFVQTPTL